MIQIGQRFDFKIPVPPQYVHPDKHPATIIQEDAEHRFVTDEEKVLWNSNISSKLIFEGQKIIEIGKPVEFTAKGNIAFVSASVENRPITVVALSKTFSTFNNFTVFFSGEKITLTSLSYEDIILNRVVVI